MTDAGQSLQGTGTLFGEIERDSDFVKVEQGSFTSINIDYLYHFMYHFIVLCSAAVLFIPDQNLFL